jgi:hypothetical protein
VRPIEIRFFSVTTRSTTFSSNLTIISGMTRSFHNYKDNTLTFSHKADQIWLPGYLVAGALVEYRRL